MSNRFVRWLVYGSGFRRLFKFGIKRRRIACQNRADGILSSLFVDGCIVANEASAAYTTHDAGTKAHAIQFEAFCLFARASHDGNVFPAIGVNLRRRRSSVSALNGFIRHGIGINGSWQNAAVCLWWLVVRIRLLHQLLKRLLLLLRRWSVRSEHAEWCDFVVLSLSI